ncbi:MAG: hypothetical protein V4449_01985 [Patescibacteria group bacterium]
MEKITRAKQLIDELQIKVTAYFAADPYKIGTKKDPVNGRLIYYIQEIKDLPVEIKTITGDVIQNLRSALDQLAYSLFIKAGGAPADARHVYFPIVESEIKFKEANTQKKIAGLSQIAVNAIIAVRPYKEGNIRLWQLHELNNLDKHRLLITAGSSFGSMDIASHALRLLSAGIPGMENISMPPVFIKPADNLFPLKQGDELFIDGPEATPNPKISFNIQLVLNETGIAEGQPLMPFLRGMADEVETTFNVFKPLL